MTYLLAGMVFSFPDFFNPKMSDRVLVRTVPGESTKTSFNHFLGGQCASHILIHSRDDSHAIVHVHVPTDQADC